MADVPTFPEDDTTAFERQKGGPWTAPSQPPTASEQAIEHGEVLSNIGDDAHTGVDLPQQYKARGTGDVRAERAPHEQADSNA